MDRVTSKEDCAYIAFTSLSIRFLDDVAAVYKWSLLLQQL